MQKKTKKVGVLIYRVPTIFLHTHRLFMRMLKDFRLFIHLSELTIYFTRKYVSLWISYSKPVYKSNLIFIKGVHTDLI